MTGRYAAFLGLAAMLAAPASAASDPVNDLLGTYLGPASASLDIVDARVRFDGSTFNLSATMNGPIPSQPGLLYVWGVNRGAGTARLNALSTPALDSSVRWDSLAVQLTDGTLRVVAFPPAGAPSITPVPGAVMISGNSITTSVPLALWPTRGFDPTSYTFQLWSRLRVNPAVDGFNSEIADFGPRVFASVPEPASWAMMVLGFGTIGWAARKPRSRRPARCALAVR